MAYAKVSISDVSKFKSAVENENHAAREVKRAISEIDSIIPRINSEIEAMRRADKECGIQIEYASNTINRIERKISQLNNELANCKQYYSESVCVGTDEEGNEIWETKYYENPRYNEIIRELSDLNRIIGELSRLKQLIVSQRTHLHNYINVYTQSVSDMRNAKTEIQNAAQSICNNSDKASEKLEKAIEAISEYMNISASLVAVPSFRSISYGPTTYTFSSVLTTREKIEYSPRETYDRNGTHDAFYGVSDRHLSRSNNDLLRSQGIY